MKTKTVKIVNISYLICVISIVLLIAYASYLSHLYWESRWLGYSSDFFSPFVLSIYILLAINILTIPTVLLTRAVWKLNNISKSRYFILKGIAIWIPAVICIFSLYVMFHELVFVRIMFLYF